MLVTVLHRLEDLPAGSTLAFSDTAAGLWYSDAVAWASEKGIVNGNPDGTFRPNGQITREQLAPCCVAMLQALAWKQVVQVA